MRFGQRSVNLNIVSHITVGGAESRVVGALASKLRVAPVWYPCSAALLPLVDPTGENG